jgi:hypothetical protein
LTDLAKRFDNEKPGDFSSNWMRNADTLELLEGWETMHNPSFNLVHLDEVKKDLGKNQFIISPAKWVELTNAIGLNMGSYNAILLRNGLNQWQRTNERTRTAAEQMKIFEETNVTAIRRLCEADAKLG